MRLGATGLSRSARADALFRRLRFDKADQIADALTRAPRRLTQSDIDGLPEDEPPAKNRMPNLR